jgi:drug/metabolite transporter (DMT)-like permease
VTWITAAIAAAAGMGVVAILDSHLLTKRIPSLRSFLLPIGIMHLVFGLVVLGIYPFPEEIGAVPLLVAFGSGIVRSAGAIIMLNTIRSQEISRVIPVVHTYPIFVAILAVPVLGETLGSLQWLGIIITVAGAALISVQRDSSGQRTRLHKSFIILLGSSLLLGLANVGSKYALDYISFWNMYTVNSVCFGIIFLLMSARPRVLNEIRQINQRGIALSLLLLNELLVVAGVILFFWAMEQGPVSLVATITGTRPAFVFIFALALSRIFPAVLEESLSRGIIALKVVSIALIVGGVTLLTLSA